VFNLIKKEIFIMTSSIFFGISTPHRQSIKLQPLFGEAATRSLPKHEVSFSRKPLETDILHFSGKSGGNVKDMEAAVQRCKNAHIKDQEIKDVINKNNPAREQGEAKRTARRIITIELNLLAESKEKEEAPKKAAFRAEVEPAMLKMKQVITQMPDDTLYPNPDDVNRVRQKISNGVPFDQL
jgi:hypothetical protein